MGIKVREKVKESGVWWVFVNHDSDRSSTLVGSLKAANKTAEDLQHRLALGLELFPEKKQAPAAPTLAAYCSKFEAGYLKAAVRESTAERYDQCFRIHILPKLGKLALNEVTREEIKGLIADLVAKNLARHSIRNVTACLCSVLSHAVEDTLIAHNPATKLGRYFKQAHVLHDKIEPLTEDEVPLFLAAVSERDGKRYKGAPECFPLFLCAIHTAMRAGELAGLQWGDIDWNGKFLVVRRSVKRGKINPTKTDRIRRIDMSDDLIEELGAFRRRCLAAALRNGKNEIPEWVFASGDGTARDMHNIERRELGKCLQAAKLRNIRLHDLRHTTASILIQRGAPLAYIRDLLGHSSIKVTVDIYGHLVPGANRQEMNRLPSLTRKPGLRGESRDAQGE